MVMDSPAVLFTSVPNDQFYSQVADCHRASTESLNNFDTSVLSMAHFKSKVSAAAVKLPYYEYKQE